MDGQDIEPRTTKSDQTRRALSLKHSPLVAFEVVETLDDERAKVQRKDGQAGAVAEVEEIRVHGFAA